MRDPVEERPAKRRPGRPTTVQRDDLAAAGLELFLRQGFDATTMTGVAEAAGVGRKTLFAHFPTKADLVWNRFNRQLERLEHRLEEAPRDVPPVRAVVDAVLGGLSLAPADLPVLRAELLLIRSQPSLQAHAYVAGKPWRQAISRFLAERTGRAETHVLPVVVGHGFWEAMFVGFNDWLDGPEPLPTRQLRAALKTYADAVEASLPARPATKKAR